MFPALTSKPVMNLNWTWLEIPQLIFNPYLTLNIRFRFRFKSQQ